MNKSDTIINISKALVKLQGGLKTLSKSADNPYYHSRYTPLEAIVEATREDMAANGLCVVQFPSQTGMETIIIHTSGEWIGCDSKWAIDTSNPQKIGSAITYMRRYCMCSALGIVSALEDDDGNVASAQQPKTTPQLPPKPPRLKKPVEPKGEPSEIEKGFPEDTVLSEDMVSKLREQIKSDTKLDLASFNSYLSEKFGVQLEGAIPMYETLRRKDYAAVMTMLKQAKRKHETKTEE